MYVDNREKRVEHRERMREIESEREREREREREGGREISVYYSTAGNFFAVIGVV